MRLIIVFFCILCFSCKQQTHDLISPAEIEEICSLQLQDNFSDLQDMKENIVLSGIDTSPINLKLWTDLIAFHEELSTKYDSIDKANSDNASEIAKSFIDKWFQRDSTRSIKIPVNIDDETPKAILVLALAMAEREFIVWTKNSFDTKVGYFQESSHKAVFLFPRNVSIKKGERLSGHVVYGAIADMTNIDSLVEDVSLNGQPLQHDQFGWQFDFVPKIEDSTQKTFELRVVVKTRGDMQFADTKTIYIQN